MTNEEWLVEKWKKFTKWYAKRIWWFVLLFTTICLVLLTVGVIMDSNLMYAIIPLMMLFGICSGYGITNWLELEHKETGK